MSENKPSGGTATVLSIVVVAFSILWVLVRPDLWVWALGFVVITITMLKLSHKAGVRQGRESLINAEPFPQDKEQS